MKKILYKFPIFLITLIFIISIFTIIPGDSEAASGPISIICIGLDQPTQTADVSPGSYGSVEFSGTVSLELNSATTAIVTLFVQDTWGTAEVKPEALQFSSNDRGTKVFRVSVRVPLGTSASEVGYILVNAYGTLYPSNRKLPDAPSGGVPGRIDIEPYYEFGVNCADKYKNVRAGDEVEFKINIENQGNYVDNYTIRIDNQDELINKGLTVYLDKEYLEIPEKNASSVKLKLRSSEIVNSFNLNDIQLNVSSNLFSEENGKPLFEPEILRVCVRPGWALSLTEFSATVILMILIFVLIVGAIYKKKLI